MRDQRSLLAIMFFVAVVGCATQRPSTAGSARDKSPLEQTELGFYQEVSWAPDGSALTLSVMEQADTPEGFRYRVHRLTFEPLEVVALTPGPMDLWTSWAPDGDRIAYASRFGETSDIVLVRADGSGRTRLTDHPANDTQPDWSPDGTHIAFVSSRGGTEHVYVMKDDGSEQTRVGVAERDAQNPDWSPDGKQIVYYETDATGNDEIYVMNADGTGRRRLAKGVWPSWSPDASKILFGAPQGLSVMHVDGTGESLLVVAVEFGAFSPDGTRIAYIKTSDGQVSVYVMNADGSGTVCHSYLSASTGSSRAARLAGSMPNTRPMPIDTPVATTALHTGTPVESPRYPLSA